MIISCNTIVDRRDHVQYLTVSKSYSDNCTTEYNIKKSVLWSDTNVKQNMIFKIAIRFCQKRFICLKNVIILSICISWNNSFMLSTWKQLFLTCAKSPHSKRKWRAVNGASQPTHCGCSSPFSKYEWVTLVWPKRSRAKTTSSLLMFRTTDWYSPIVGLMSRSLLPMLLFHEVCRSSKIYLLIDGLKLENGIFKEVGSNESDVFEH